MGARSTAILLGIGLALGLAATAVFLVPDDSTPDADTVESTVASTTDSAQEPSTTAASRPSESGAPQLDPTPTTTVSIESSAPAAPRTSATTSAPTSTDADAEIRAAILEYYDNYWQCLRVPALCDPAATTVEGSAAFDELAAVARTLEQNGLFVGNENTGYVVVESVEFQADRAIATTCWWTTAVLYLRSPIEGDPPIPQTNPPTSGKQTYELTQDPSGEVWRIQRADQSGELTEDVNEC